MSKPTHSNVPWLNDALQKNATEKTSWGTYGKSYTSGLNEHIQLQQQLKLAQAQNPNANIRDAAKRVSLLNSGKKKHG